MEGNSHFKGKSALEHLKEARQKGFFATKEAHGLEAPGHLISGADAAKELAIFVFMLSIIADLLKLPTREVNLLITLFMVGFFFWKMGRSAVLAWTRLERVNNLIAEEKHEIETNREEEKEELTEMYEAKGFSGELLEKVIDVLMADDNKLLGVMLEEELGVSLEAYEHPLKQASGAGIGAFISACGLGIGMAFSDNFGIPIACFLIIAFATYVMATIEKVRILNAIVWNWAVTFLAGFGTYFLTRFLIHEVL